MIIKATVSAVQTVEKNGKKYTIATLLPAEQVELTAFPRESIFEGDSVLVSLKNGRVEDIKKI